MLSPEFIAAWRRVKYLCLDRPLEAKTLCDATGTGPYYAHHSRRFFYNSKINTTGQFFSVRLIELCACATCSLEFINRRHQISWHSRMFGYKLPMLRLPHWNWRWWMWQWSHKILLGNRAWYFSVYPYFHWLSILDEMQVLIFDHQLNAICVAVANPYQKVADYFKKSKSCMSSHFYSLWSFPVMACGTRHMHFEGKGRLGMRKR